MTPPNSISESLDSADWDFIAHTLQTMYCGIEGKCPKTRRLRAKLGIIRLLISNEIKGWNGSNSIDLSFFVASLKSIRGMESELESLGIKKTEFVIFLGLILKRFEKQKLRAKKPLATLSEFKKMKGVVENGPGHL